MKGLHFAHSNNFYNWANNNNNNNIVSNPTSLLAPTFVHSFEEVKDTRLTMKGSHDFSRGDVIEAVVSEEPDEYGSWTVS